MNMYPDEKLDALAAFLNIDPEKTTIHVWSDDSITIGDQDNIEYYVSEEVMEDHELAGRENGFMIYRCVQFMKKEDGA